MRVICVDSTLYIEDVPPIKEGIDYEVLDEKEHLGFHVYLIFSTKETDYWYWAKGFIPLSEIDETELVNQKVETYDTGVMGRE